MEKEYLVKVRIFFTLKKKKQPYNQSAGGVGDERVFKGGEGKTGLRGWGEEGGVVQKSKNQTFKGLTIFQWGETLTITVCM